jgi:hypothetical protein
MVFAPTDPNSQYLITFYNNLMPMPKNKKHTPKRKLQIVLAADGIKGFFKRGKAIAKLADAGKPIPHKYIINFDSSEERQ